MRNQSATERPSLEKSLGRKEVEEGEEQEGGRREEEEEYLQLLPSLLSGPSVSRTTHTWHDQHTTGWRVGWGVRGQRSASCCDTSRILLPTSLWGVCLSVCVLLQTCLTGSVKLIFILYEKCCINKV